MTVKNLDNDDKMIVAAIAAVDALEERFWSEKRNNEVSYDVIYDLQKRYEEAALELFKLKTRMLVDTIITKDIDLKDISDIQLKMKQARTNKDFLISAVGLIKLLVTII